MLLVDTSVWIDHLHNKDVELVQALRGMRVAQHSMIIGELALGTLQRRDDFLSLLQELPSVTQATHDDVMTLVEGEALFGHGLSLVDAHLITSVRLTPGTRLWTRDKRLRSVAVGMGIAHDR